MIQDSTTLYELAQRALVVAYWWIGKRFVKEEQRGQPDVAYGSQLLADIFYLSGSSTPKTIIEKEIFLNQPILDKGLAQARER